MTVGFLAKEALELTAMIVGIVIIVCWCFVMTMWTRETLWMRKAAEKAPSREEEIQRIAALELAERRNEISAQEPAV